MTRVLILYYSSYGHLEQMAHAIAEGVRVAGAEASIKRVPELVPEDVAKASRYKTQQTAPVARVDELVDYDAIIIGAPSRFGVIASQMKHFLDQTGALWYQNKLVGKVGAMFSSSGTQHGGQEATILGTLPFFLHHGMVIAGLPYISPRLMRVDEVSGGSPYGAATISGADNARQPSENELDLARIHGKHVAEVAIKQRVSVAAAARLG